MDICDMLQCLADNPPPMERGAQRGYVAGLLFARSLVLKGKDYIVESTGFDVVLTSFGAKKISVIKALRGITSLGLKESKDLVENAPQPIKFNVSRVEADGIRMVMEEAGGSVEIKPSTRIVA